MKKKCRFTSFILASALLLASYSPASAINPSPSSHSSVQLSKSDGSYVVTEDQAIDKGMNKTSVSDVYVAPGEKYFIRADDTHYLAANKLEFSLSESQQVENMISKNNVAPEIAKKIRELSDLAVSTDSSGATATLFTTAPSASSGIVSTYYTYQGHKMRSDVLSTTGLNTTWKTIQTGSTTKTVANSIANCIISTIGISSKTIGIVGAGKSVLDLFTDYYNNFVITGSTSDSLQMRLVYDTDIKWVYGDYSNNNNWMLGLTTQRVKVTRFGVEQYYFNANTREGHTKSSDTYVSSPSWYSGANYASPWATAWTYILYPKTEYITWKIYNSTVMF